MGSTFKQKNVVVSGRGLKFKDALTSLGCGITTATLEVFIKAGLFSIYVLAYDNLALVKLDDNSWLTFICGLVIFDFIWYWAHRLSHEVNFLWGGHVPHQQSEEFNLTTALRQGALQDTMYWPLYMTMALMGFSLEMFVAQVMTNKFYGFWLHTRTIGKIPLVEGILSTPSAHRVHHGMNDIYLDKNHGGIFMIFDRIFGTYQEETEEVIFGVRKRYASFDPVRAHFDWLISLWNDARQTGSWRDKLRLWFMPTGWRPADLEKKMPRQELSLQNFTKFNSPTSLGSRRLTLVWAPPLSIFAMIAAASQVLTLPALSLGPTLNIGLALFTLVGLYGLGRLLNLQKPAASSQSGKMGPK